MKQIKDNEAVFGDLNIIVTGDFFQLRSARDHYLFENELLWQLLMPFFLDTNVRQWYDTVYSLLLNKARVGLLNDADINLLKTRLSKALAFEPSCAIHLFR